MKRLKVDSVEPEEGESMGKCAKSNDSDVWPCTEPDSSNESGPSTKPSTEVEWECRPGTSAIRTNLLDLSDDVLLLIFASLKPHDLFNLGQTCSRLAEVTQDRSLWLHADDRGRTADSASLDFYLRRLRPATTTFAVDFPPDPTANLYVEMPVDDVMRRVAASCRAMHTLALENVFLDASLTKYKDFPRTLRHLSLKGSSMRNPPTKHSYFQDCNNHTPSLEVLILSDCLWFEPHSIMVVAKCERLRELRLDGCECLGNCMAYCSMAARFAFKSLETLDLRNTRMNNSDVSCFNVVSTLRHLYLSGPCGRARRRRKPAGYIIEALPDPGYLIVLTRVGNEFRQSLELPAVADLSHPNQDHLNNNDAPAAADHPDPYSRHLTLRSDCLQYSVRRPVAHPQPPQAAGGAHFNGCTQPSGWYLDAVAPPRQERRMNEVDYLPAATGRADGSAIAGGSKDAGVPCAGTPRVDTGDVAGPSKVDTSDVAGPLKGDTSNVVGPSKFSGRVDIAGPSEASGHDIVGPSMTSACDDSANPSKDIGRYIAGPSKASGRCGSSPSKGTGPNELGLSKASARGDRLSRSKVGGRDWLSPAKVTIWNKQLTLPKASSTNGANPANAGECEPPDSPSRPPFGEQSYGLMFRRRDADGTTDFECVPIRAQGDGDTASEYEDDDEQPTKHVPTSSESEITDSEEEAERGAGSEFDGLSPSNGKQFRPLPFLDGEERPGADGERSEPFPGGKGPVVMTDSSTTSTSSSSSGGQDVSSDDSPWTASDSDKEADKDGGTPLSRLKRTLRKRTSRGERNAEATALTMSRVEAARSMALRAQRARMEATVTFAPPEDTFVTDFAVFDLFNNFRHSRGNIGGGGQGPGAGGGGGHSVTIRMYGARPAAGRLETIVLRDYPRVTDASLQVFAEVPTLREVDVTNTGVTRRGVESFRVLRPDVRLRSSFD